MDPNFGEKTASRYSSFEMALSSLDLSYMKATTATSFDGKVEFNKIDYNYFEVSCAALFLSLTEAITL